MPLRDGFFSTATQTSCCNRIQRSNRVRLLVVSTHDFPDIESQWTDDARDGTTEPVSSETISSGGANGRKYKILNP